MVQSTVLHRDGIRTGGDGMTTRETMPRLPDDPRWIRRIKIMPEEIEALRLAVREQRPYPTACTARSKHHEDLVAENQEEAPNDH